MRRVVAILTLLFSATRVIRGLWMLGSPEITPYIVQDATDIHVVSLGLGQRQISYRTAGPPYTWFFSVARNLENSGFHLSWRPDQSPTYDPKSPLLFQRAYGTLLRDDVVLSADSDDPQRATITVHRRLIIPPWRSLLPT